MRRFFFIATAVAVLIVGGAAGVAAQENATNATTANGTAANATATPTPSDPQVSTSTVQLHPTVTLERMELKNGTLTMWIRAEVPQRMVLVDSGQMVDAVTGEGDGLRATSIDRRAVNLLPGRQKVRISPTEVNGVRAVTVTVGNSMTFIHSGSLETPAPAVAWDTAQGLILIAGGGAAGMTYRRVREKRDAEQKEAERRL